MRPTVLLVRHHGTDQGTLGRLIAPGFACYTLELPDRGNRPNVSRIPEGLYDLDWIRPRRAFSGYHELYWVHDVPGRSGILIHPGNFAGDTAIGYRTDSFGCILLGMACGTLGGQLAVLESRRAVRLFHEAMRQQPARIRIVDAVALPAAA